MDINVYIYIYIYTHTHIYTYTWYMYTHTHIYLFLQEVWKGLWPRRLEGHYQVRNFTIWEAYRGILSQLSQQVGFFMWCGNSTLYSWRILVVLCLLGQSSLSLTFTNRNGNTKLPRCNTGSLIFPWQLGSPT